MLQATSFMAIPMVRCMPMGARWKVTEVQIDYPRLTLTLGGLYNGGTPTET